MNNHINTKNIEFVRFNSMDELSPRTISAASVEKCDLCKKKEKKTILVVNRYVERYDPNMMQVRTRTRVCSDCFQNKSKVDFNCEANEYRFKQQLKKYNF